jgi:hypothetical protein
MSWSDDFVDQLEGGLRSSRPKYLPESLFTPLMQDCCHKIPKERPTFTQIRQVLEKFQQTNPCLNRTLKPKENTTYEVELKEANYRGMAVVPIT